MTENTEPCQLEDLVIGHFRVERVGRRMLALPDPNGKYRAVSAELVERALTERKPPQGVEVKKG